MAVWSFVRKYREELLCIFVAVALCSLVAALIVAFDSGVLPYSDDGDAFDTIYALNSSQNG